MLWLCEHSRCATHHHAMTHIANENKKRNSNGLNLVFVFYYLCRSRHTLDDTMKHFVLSFLHQISQHLPRNQRSTVVKQFLSALLKLIRDEGRRLEILESLIHSNNIKGSVVESIFTHSWISEIWAALSSVLPVIQEEILFVIDGLDNVQQGGDFYMRLRVFIKALRLKSVQSKILLASSGSDGIGVAFHGWPCIHHDKEREGVSTQNILHQKQN